MEFKKYANEIVLDGCLDEQVWENAKVITGFKRMGLDGLPVNPAHDTVFKILPFEDRVYFGIKCMEPDMEWLKNEIGGIYNTTDAVELFFATSGSPYDYYQFFISSKGDTLSNYYEEEGNIKPDRYAPVWKTAVYFGENYWSVEVEMLLTTFYMTPQQRWNDTWLVNVARTHIGRHGRFYSTWATLNRGFRDPKRFLPVEGFPIRDPRNDVYITNAQATIAEQTADGYKGTMKLLAKCAVAGKYEFSSDHADTIVVDLEEGFNEFYVPCHFEETTLYKVALSLKRLEDGVEFKRGYPIMVIYEPIVLKFTLPEYRGNFYPGQDYSKIVGKAVAAKPVTLTLEGPGIPKQVIAPDAEGNFTFETPDFEVGEAFLTASVEGYELVQKIRRLAPTGRQMSWISGGNLIVNGEPVLRRNMYADYYRGGEAFKRKYDADDLHQTLEIRGNIGHVQPGRLIKGCEAPGGEASKHARPTEEMLRLVDATIEANKGRDFTYYYISDEPECRGLSKVYLKHLYQYIAEKDPYHVILTASRNANELVDIADWFETHPYINPHTDEEGKRHYCRGLSTLGKFVDDIVKLNRPDKCIGFLPTCFGSMKKKLEPYPTFDEYILHTWAPMIRGGKTLWPYAYHDLGDRASLYEGTRYVFSSFEALDKIVLHGKRTTLLKTPEVEAVLYEYGEEKMFVLVNLTNKLQKVTLDGISGTWHEFRHARLITSNTSELKPVETVIGTSHVKDAGLPTYQEMAALVDQLEYERTHSGNLLFARGGDITVTTSGSAVGIKLFDGVKDVWAWEQSSEDEKFIDLDLKKMKPTIQKVVLHGWHIEDAELTIGVGDEMIAPAVKEIKTEEFSKTFLLEEAVCAEKLHFTFKAKRIELYEIEAF